MGQVDQFLSSLKRALKAKNIIYKDLARSLNLSESSIKRILSDKTIGLDRLEEILKATDISFAEVCKMANFEQENVGYPLTEDQEFKLSQDKKLVHLLVLLTSGSTLKRIEKEYEITPAEMSALLLKLDRLKIIELHPNNRIKFLISNGTIQFRKNGPIGKMIMDHVKSNYLKSNFDAEEEYFRMGTFEFSKSSIQKMKKKLDKLLLELEQESTVDSELKEKTHDLGIVLSFRPWVNDSLDVLKKRK